MSEHRPVVLTLTAFATAMAALAVAALTAWLRCGRGSNCSSELALAIVAAGPACLIGILMLIILRTKLRTPWVRGIALAAGIGVAALPLAAFLLQDVKLLPIFSVLVAAAVLLAVLGERAAEETASAVRRRSAAPATRQFRGAAGVGRAAKGRASSHARREELLAFLDELTVLNQELARLGELLARRGYGSASTLCASRMCYEPRFLAYQVAPPSATAPAATAAAMPADTPVLGPDEPPL
jgi:hypothetical protein